ncbi:DUF4214 domain-containing protein [Duganella sp. sic0402]|uniref:DUF4214 domain-containing protein n=1 Tax=Duganella sp. sic0402 TaxID=2854786 RepID=UPI001C44B90E|nr:DUF4214 domain-containing protein [Duganella sp. sic0402]MBV7539438.1 DUF4214 domain-containing protein [Duganella sp. sic0402]
MKKTLASSLTLAVLLAACGGSDTTSNTPKSAAMGARSVQGASAAPEQYTELVQSMYLGFFGRPADAPGLPFWRKNFSNASLPLTTLELSLNYTGNADIRRIVDAFADSTESQDLYTGNNNSFVNAVYLNAFNRNAEAAGREFWAGFIDRKELTRAQVLLRILQGAQNSDAAVLGKKLQAALYFTAALDQEQEIVAYDGRSANQGARDLLATITDSTDMAAFQKQIDDFIVALGGGAEQLVVKRYAGFHYLQDMSNAPAYPAYSSYVSFGVAPPGANGKTVYGEIPQTVTWTRDPNTRAPVYSAPVLSNAGLPAGSVTPEVAMLCTAVATPNGDVTKSTDVLVARSARQLSNASQLAGQTLSIYRENCATGGSNVTRFSFDASGNGSFPSSSGLLTFDAAAVTSVLNGQVLPDLSTGKWLSFTAYSYVRADDSTGYFVVQHLGNRKSGVSDGVLAIWSQE